ncbi:MAG: hypothetical protein ACREN5_02760, partial [Gemmatimonadales bacterium]
MNLLLVVMRLLHIGLGVFWVGTILFNAFFLGPAMAEAGPDGAKVMAGLMRRRFMQIMPAVGIVTILSGLWLYWHVSGGFQAGYMRSRGGMTLGLGALAAILSFAVGITVVRPAMVRATSATDPATAQAARLRAARGGRI